MSLLITQARRSDGSDKTTARRVPVVLPLVEMHIDATGELNVALDHQPYTLLDSWGRGREAVAHVVEQITTELDTPVRIEVHEANGSVFTDILTPHPAYGADSASEGSTAQTAVASRLEGEGFEPGEDVAIAVVVTHQMAAPDGTVTFRLPPTLLEAQGRRLMLVGRTSGTISRPTGVGADNACSTGEVGNGERR